MNPFDNLQSAMFATVTRTMGYQATWIPSGGGSEQTAEVLYNGPTEKEKLFSADYDPNKLTMEYKEGDFQGLKESTDSGETETVCLDSIGTFIVRGIKKTFDGKTYTATLVNQD
jgi:hypothetical protein